MRTVSSDARPSPTGPSLPSSSTDDVRPPEPAGPVAEREKREVVHEVLAASRSCFTWDYERSRPALAKLYERAKNSQWNVSTDIDWGIDVDPWRIARDSD